MKRSFMIALMAQELQWDGLDTSGVSLEEITNDLLSVCERNGMLPPSIPTNASGWEIGKGALAYINKWESEDE